MPDVTSKDIKAVTGIKNAATLTRWHKKGLIPEPEIRKQADNKGMIAYWPEWVLHRCVRIKQLVNAGWSLPKIKQTLGTDWERDKAKFARSFGQVTRSADRNAAFWNLEEDVGAVLTRMISRLDRKLKNTKTTFLHEGLVQQTIPMMAEGVNPVLVVIDNEVYVTADFSVSEYLANHRSVGDAITVIPFGRELQAYLGRSESLPIRPRIRPSDLVIEQTAKGRVELSFHSVDTWGFEISAVPRSEVKPTWDAKEKKKQIRKK